MAEPKKKFKSSRLTRSFHQSFVPEKQYLGKILQYAAGNGVFDMQTIADSTGIPTGKSSGKAIPTADYCIGMGLLKSGKINGQTILSLTPFGRTVLLEDKFFRESLTQWIAHLSLCDKQTGAEIWYQTFWAGTSILGETFTKDSLHEWLCTTQKIASQNIAGPTLSMYENEISFASCGAVSTTKDTVTRKMPPRTLAYAVGYAAWLATSIERAGRGGAQVTVDELEDYCGFRSVTAWNLLESQEVLTLLERKGLISVDRHMHPWIVCMKHSAESLWQRLYEDFV